jgi:hypothetical protein
MIVVDEQLLGYGLPETIQKWYPGKVTDIRQLRPGSIIKDDAVPSLLRLVREPTFVTINVADFWRKMRPDRNFMIACFAFLQSEAYKVSDILKRLLAVEPFQTKKKRMGKIVHVTEHEIRYYSVESWAVEVIEWPRQRAK